MLLQLQDRILKRFPELEWVLGKTGRAETSTDPAPFSMGETVVMPKTSGARWVSTGPIGLNLFATLATLY